MSSIQVRRATIDLHSYYILPQHGSGCGARAKPTATSPTPLFISLVSDRISRAFFFFYSLSLGNLSTYSGLAMVLDPLVVRFQMLQHLKRIEVKISILDGWAVKLTTR